MTELDENRIPEYLCGYFNHGNFGVTFVPETWRENAAALWLTGGGGMEKSYVDGSGIMAVPFEVRVRCVGRSIGDRLDVIALFGSMAEYVRTCPMGEEQRIAVTSGASKSAVYENGEEEYRAAYVFRYRKN